MKVLAKLRRGVVEIAAQDECLYAHLTFFQRAYLLWTFRNFRRLSVRVLNDRQRRLVERLAQAAHGGETQRITPELVIGRAEFAKLPLPKSLEWISVPQIRETRLPVSQRRRALNLHQLATFPRAITQRAARALAHPPAPFQSHARYSLGLIFTLGSLVIISGALAQRLWIGHGKQVVSATPPSQPVPAQRTDNTTELQPLAPRSVPISASAPGVEKPTSPAALLLSPPAVSALASKIKAVASVAEPLKREEVISKTAEMTTTSRVRVSLAPHTVIYPSIPGSGVSANGKKQILVKALINSQGVVDDVEVPGETPKLAAAIARTVRKWHYEPYFLNGQAVDVETRMVFTVLGPDAITVRFLPAND